VPVFTVPDGKMDEFVANFGDFYKLTREGTKELLYYGFAVSDNQVMCREGYTSAHGVLQHLEDVKAPLDLALGIVGEGALQLWVVGPSDQLDILRTKLAPLGALFWELDVNSLKVEGASDNLGTHVSLVPVFTVPDEKMNEFVAKFGDFYKFTREGTKEVLYYGFAVNGNQVMCREGYSSAHGVIQHLEDVKALLDLTLDIVGEGGLQLWAVGPGDQLDILRPKLAPLGAVFWEFESKLE